jgi:hypothetical protein
MKRRLVAAGLALALGTTGLAGGCSEAPRVSGSMEEATVQGMVRVRGKPVTNGRVTFRSSNINRPTAQTKEAEIGADGRYSITTLVGENFVEVTCKELFAAKNRPMIENEQMVQFHSGQNTFNIDLPPQGPAKVE